MSTNFILHDRLSQDSFHVVYLSLCELRLMNCQDFPWLLLIPMKNDVVHLIDLSVADQIQLMAEINKVAKILSNHFSPDRVNIAGLGNIVPQMHWHLIARHSNDKVWPNPVWGHSFSPYSNNTHKKIIDRIKNDIL